LSSIRIRKIEENEENSNFSMSLFFRYKRATAFDVPISFSSDIAVGNSRKNSANARISQAI
jgi:hypothetical protein